METWLRSPWLPVLVILLGSASSVFAAYRSDRQLLVHWWRAVTDWRSLPEWWREARRIHRRDPR